MLSNAADAKDFAGNISGTRAHLQELPTGNEVRPIQLENPHLAVARTVELVQRTKVFASLPFGIVTSLIMGQVNRGHYFFAMRGEKVVGYAGWALATRTDADAWLDENQPLPKGSGHEGEIICLNMWIGDGRETNSEMVDLLRRLNRKQTHIFGRRFYPDGRVRSTRVKL